MFWLKNKKIIFLLCTLISHRHNVTDLTILTNGTLIKLDTINSDWSIVYIDGSQVIISKLLYMYFFL